MLRDSDYLIRLTNHGQGQRHRRGHCRDVSRHRTSASNIDPFIIEQATRAWRKLVPVFLYDLMRWRRWRAWDLMARFGELAIQDGSGGIRSWRGTLLFQLDLQKLRRELGDVNLILLCSKPIQRAPKRMSAAVTGK